MMVRQAHHERLRKAPLTLSLSKGRPEPVEGFFIIVLAPRSPDNNTPDNTFVSVSKHRDGVMLSAGMDPGQPMDYQIRTKGHLGRECTDWVDGFAIVTDEKRDTRVSRQVVQQDRLQR